MLNVGIEIKNTSSQKTQTKDSKENTKMSSQEIKGNHLDFTGKVVSFSTAEDSLAMVDAKFMTQENRLFIVGVIPKGATKNDWAEGRPCAISWDAVTDYMVFDSEDQYVELISKSE